MSVAENLQPLAYAVATIIFVIAFISTLLRFYARVYIVKDFGWDDWVMASIFVRRPEIFAGSKANNIIVLEYRTAMLSVPIFALWGRIVSPFQVLFHDRYLLTI
jgi:hypothetical protein